MKRMKVKSLIATSRGQWAISPLVRLTSGKGATEAENLRRGSVRRAGDFRQ